MKHLLLIAFAIFISTQSKAEECFAIKPSEPLTGDTCGPVEATVEAKSCDTQVVSKTFSATVGLDCLDTPKKLKLLYNDKMLVSELTLSDKDNTFTQSKTYSEDFARMPAQAKPRLEKGQTCFTMRPVEEIDAQSCNPVRAQIQFLSCETHQPIGTRLEVTTHFSCGEAHPELKYWYKRMMLVGSLKKTNKGFRIAGTYTLVYPSIYGVYNDRKTSSVAPNP